MDNLYVILLKDLIVLPSQKVKIELLADSSKNIISASKDREEKILVVAPLNPKELNPDVDDLPKIGVIAAVKSKIDLSNGNIRVTLQGEKRVIIENYFYNENNLLEATTRVLSLPKYNEIEEKATKRKIKASIKKYVKINTSSSNTIISYLDSLENLNEITDLVTSFLPFNTDKKLEYMQMINPINRAKNLISDIEEEIEIIRIDNEIEETLKNKLLKKEKEYFLKEKLAEIKEELGEKDEKEEEIALFYYRLNKLKINKNLHHKLTEELEKYRILPNDSAERAVIRNYLETVISLPWNKSSKENLDIKKISSQLKESHYGLNEVKERICDYAEIKSISKSNHNPKICLVGPPGVGKTSIASSIASALNRKFIKISVGGLNDSIELIGSRKTYLGANPGKIIQSIKRSGVNNPVILIDEIDKMVKDYKGDPASTLLEILDDIQNKEFTDNYIEEAFDLSNTMFILTANDVNDIPYALKDRLEIINLNSYTSFDKISIANNYLIPRIIKEYNYIGKTSLSDNLIKDIVNKYTKEAGVRELDRLLHQLYRKIILNNDRIITEKTILKYLGNEKYGNIEYSGKEKLGVVNTLAYTTSGGVVTKLEVIKYKGTGKIIVTGMLGDTLKESIDVALSYLKFKYKIDFKSNDIHLHFLDGATKKDGPSSGISILVALLSISSNKVVSNDIAFTGEITLNGNVLKIGGAKEKVISAINEGIKTLYLPTSNKHDILDIPEKYSKGVKIIYIDNFDKIYKDIFE